MLGVFSTLLPGPLVRARPHAAYLQHSQTPDLGHWCAFRDLCGSCLCKRGTSCGYLRVYYVWWDSCDWLEGRLTIRLGRLLTHCRAATRLRGLEPWCSRQLVGGLRRHRCPLIVSCGLTCRWSGRHVLKTHALQLGSQFILKTTHAKPAHHASSRSHNLFNHSHTTRTQTNAMPRMK